VSDIALILHIRESFILIILTIFPVIVLAACVRLDDAVLIVFCLAARVHSLESDRSEWWRCLTLRLRLLFGLPCLLAVLTWHASMHTQVR
jgi:hypothetical protein